MENNEMKKYFHPVIWNQGAYFTISKKEIEFYTLINLKKKLNVWELILGRLR